jgi:hypothetical protein
MRALMLFVVALALAYVAGWGLAGTEISGPAAVASFTSLALAVTPRPAKPAQPAAKGKGKGKDKPKPKAKAKAAKPAKAAA